jgi:hypothetical protein
MNDWKELRDLITPQEFTSIKSGIASAFKDALKFLKWESKMKKPTDHIAEKLVLPGSIAGFQLFFNVVSGLMRGPQFTTWEFLIIPLSTILLSVNKDLLKKKINVQPFLDFSNKVPVVKTIIAAGTAGATGQHNLPNVNFGDPLGKREFIKYSQAKQLFGEGSILHYDDSSGLYGVLDQNKQFHKYLPDNETIKHLEMGKSLNWAKLWYYIRMFAIGGAAGLAALKLRKNEEKVIQENKAKAQEKIKEDLKKSGAGLPPSMMTPAQIKEQRKKAAERHDRVNKGIDEPFETPKRQQRFRR